MAEHDAGELRAGGGARARARRGGAAGGPDPLLEEGDLGEELVAADRRGRRGSRSRLRLRLLSSFRRRFRSRFPIEPVGEGDPIPDRGEERRVPLAVGCLLRPPREVGEEAAEAAAAAAAAAAPRGKKENRFFVPFFSFSLFFLFRSTAWSLARPLAILSAVSGCAASSGVRALPGRNSSMRPLSKAATTLAPKPRALSSSSVATSSARSMSSSVPSP